MNRIHIYINAKKVLKIQKYEHKNLNLKIKSQLWLFCYNKNISTKLSYKKVLS